ncbi:MAG: sugar diacid utilization regulator [Rhodococcus sp. (in: high G+C Gram-positive bacteria)]|nr:MAG: sugar diacid utilization regulator [Rhodococcus sp. (in: high G+C Gram-positive bacteria)]
MLSEALAQQIANEITDVIGFNVLITDASGTVVGSGDERRIGQFHEASIEVIRARRMIAHSAADVRDLVGSLPGVTIPLVIDGEVVGTIGLSGSPEQVEQFGLVVKRQTEILMQEASRIGTRLTYERAAEELLRDICDWHRSTFTEAQIVRRATGLGYDLRIPRAVVLISYDRHTDDAAAEGQPAFHTVLHAVQNVFDSVSDLVAPLARQLVAVTTAVSANTPAADAALTDRCRKYVSLVGEQGWDTWVGIGSIAHGVEQLNLSSQDAYDALRLGAVLDPRGHVYDIDRFRLHQAISVIPAETRDRLSRAALGALTTDGDWPQLQDTLIAWGECGFNSSRSAKRLHVHRNTLANRLDKIARLLGRPLDEPGLGMTLYIACVVAERAG